MVHEYTGSQLDSNATAAPSSCLPGSECWARQFFSDFALAWRNLKQWRNQ